MKPFFYSSLLTILQALLLHPAALFADTASSIKSGNPIRVIGATSASLGNASDQSVAAAPTKVYLSAHRQSIDDTLSPREVPAMASTVVDAATRTPEDARRNGDSSNAAARHTLTRDVALAALNEQVSAHYSVEGELQLELLRAWAEPAASKAPYAIVVTEFPNQLSSNLLLRARLETAGSQPSEITLTFRAQLWREVWSTRQPVSRDDTFDPSVLETRRVDTLREREAVSVSSGDRSLTFARNLPAGRLLTWRDLARRSLVKKGELVDVSANDGPLLVSMKALALQSGAAGDTILVRNIESKKDIAALIVAENRVKVRF